MLESLKSLKSSEVPEPSHGICNTLRSDAELNSGDSSVHCANLIIPSQRGFVDERHAVTTVGDALFASAILKAAVIGGAKCRPRDRIISRRATPTRGTERRSARARARALARTSGRAASRRALYLNRHVSPRIRDATTRATPTPSDDFAHARARAS